MASVLIAYGTPERQIAKISEYIAHMLGSEATTPMVRSRRDTNRELHREL